MKFLKKVFVIILIPISIWGQKDSIGINSIKKDRFFNTSYGLNYSSFRDRATSPLFYDGLGLHFGFGLTEITSKKEENFYVDANISYNTTRLPEVKNFQGSYGAVYLSFPIYYQYLRKLENIHFRNYQLAVGGTFLTIINSRLNPSLFNNAAGFDILSNLMISGKISRDFNRNETKHFKFLFLKKDFRPKQRNVGFQMNAGLINLNYRPDYTYISEAEINGTQTNLINYALHGYKVAWNGWAVKTQLDLTYTKLNGNKIRWSYVWGINHVPGRFEPVDYASHQLQLTLMFKR